MVHVLSVEPFEGEAEVYDITVEEDHSYIVGGVVVHNCLRCAPLDNQTFPIGKGPKPPLHMNCRCVRVPVVKGRDKLIEAGILKPGSRASVDGQVPESLKFEDWLKRQSEGRQKEVLGAKRLELWKNGTKLDKFVNDENEIIPLRDL